MQGCHSSYLEPMLMSVISLRDKVNVLCPFMHNFHSSYRKPMLMSMIFIRDNVSFRDV